jgi:MFS family permease
LLFTAAGASKTAVALYATVSQVAASLGQIVVGRIADRAGCKWVVVITFAVLVSSILGTGILSDRLWGLFIFGTLGTTAAWSLSTLLPSLVAHAMESHERGRVLGWVHLWWNLGMILGALGGGLLFTYRAGLPFLAVAGLNCASIALVFVFFRLGQPCAGREPG